MNNDLIRKWADHLYNAEQQRVGVQALTEIFQNMSIEQAYQVQLYNISKKINSGQVIVGKKIGLTSLAMQQLLGVDQPDYGQLLDGMIVENGGHITPDRVMQPKVEGEIAFVLKEDLIGPHVSVSDVMDATDYVVASIEVVDSRIKDWKINLADTIADNASCGLFVLGDHRVDPREMDLRTVLMTLEKNGQIMNSGVGSAALGHPANGVAWLANKLHEFGIELKAGEIILSGALSAAVDAFPGDSFRVDFDHSLGSVSVNFTDEGKHSS